MLVQSFIFDRNSIPTYLPQYIYRQKIRFIYNNNNSSDDANEKEKI